MMLTLALNLARADMIGGGMVFCERVCKRVYTVKDNALNKGARPAAYTNAFDVNPAARAAIAWVDVGFTVVVLTRVTEGFHIVVASLNAFDLLGASIPGRELHLKDELHLGWLLVHYAWGRFISL